MNSNTVIAAVGRFDPAGELRRAIDRDEFVLYYQPQLNYAGKLRGAEALIRWRHAARGMVFPADFIELAEESGLIVEIGSWVLHTACKQLALWQRKRCTRKLTLAVNISAKQVSEPNFVALTVAMIEATGADPHMLKLEITESLRVTDLVGAAAKMHLLRAMGVRFSLDDFGTGHSSLRYLKNLPLDQLKIDQSFVRDIATSGTDAAIVRSTVDLARSLGLNVIAEGVETLEQRELLAACGCFDYQGYLYDQALPADAFEQFARSRKQARGGLGPWQWKRHCRPRKLARKLYEDVAFRVLVADNFPANRSICNFRAAHLNELSGLFVQVVMLAKECGLVKLGTASIDGTKVKANASRHKAMSYDRMKKAELELKAQIDALLAKAKAADEAEKNEPN